MLGETRLLRTSSISTEKSFSIRQNLWEFLKRSASGILPFQNQNFWIDQLCIDQTATEEKNHQVQMMGQIYAGAEQGISWLGPESDGTNEAMEKVTSLGPFLTQEKISGSSSCRCWQRNTSVASGLSKKSPTLATNGLLPAAIAQLSGDQLALGTVFRWRSERSDSIPGSGSGKYLSENLSLISCLRRKWILSQ
jgi:hypothetical protein